MARNIINNPGMAVYYLGMQCFSLTLWPPESFSTAHTLLIICFQYCISAPLKPLCVFCMQLGVIGAGGFNVVACLLAGRQLCKKNG